MNRALEGSILKLNTQHAFFLTFLSKIVVLWLQMMTRKSLEKLSSIEERIEDGFTTTDEEIEAVRDKLTSKVK